MKILIKNIVTLTVIISLYILINGILNHYSIRYKKEAQLYESLYNGKLSTYTSKKSDLAYYRSGTYVKKVAIENYNLIDPNDNPSLVSYSKIIKKENNVTATVILDLFTTSLSADELKSIYSY
ncbi:hypothetical protein JEZ13_01360 [bacterium]|nr:hypothetical protein [bacterium]